MFRRVAVILPKFASSDTPGGANWAWLKALKRSAWNWSLPDSPSGSFVDFARDKSKLFRPGLRTLDRNRGELPNG
jgi:hypothetical protein